MSKPVELRGTSLEDLRDFPRGVRSRIGRAIDNVQKGEDPPDWKPMEAIGKGVREIRVRDKTGADRAIYIANYADAIYVLHCFVETTQQTSQKDIDIAKRRLAALKKELGQ